MLIKSDLVPRVAVVKTIDDMVRVNGFTPTAKQREAARAADHYFQVLFSGGLSSGKSAWLINMALTTCLKNAGSKNLLTRESKIDFDRTVRPALERWLPNDQVAKRKADEIHFLNGATLFLASALNDPRAASRLKGLEVSGAFIDEVSELTEATFTALLQRVRCSDDKVKLNVCMTSNPTTNWVRQRFWRTASPNHTVISDVVADNPFADKDYCRRMEELLPHDKFLRLMKNSWDDLDLEDQLIKATDIEAAMSRKLSKEGMIKLAVDVSRGGDSKSVIGRKQGQCIEIVDVFSGDTTQLIHKIVKAARDQKEQVLIVDLPGLGGSVVDRLRELGFLRVYEFAGSSSANSPRFRNLRSRCYWELMTNLPNLSIEKDATLRDELLSIRYELSHDRIAILSKDESRRIGLACDRSDVCAMLMWEEPSMTWALPNKKSSGPDMRSNDAVMSDYMEKESHCNRIIRPKKGPFDYNL